MTKKTPSIAPEWTLGEEAAIYLRPTELVESGPRVWEVGSLVYRRVKQMSYKIDTCRFLATCCVH